MILRTWRGWVRSEQAEEYAAYVERTGLSGYRETAGNHGCQVATRDLGDGRAEVLTLSWWESMDAIHGFAGDDVEVARFYPEDDEYLVDRETTAHHYVVADGEPGPGKS
jgi:heme-degrading monooxygenase HmoA